LLALLLAALFGLAPAQAQPEFPPLTGRVVDAAQLLSPEQEAALDAKLAALEANSTRQLVVATIPDLAGNDIADYGYQLGRSWGIGQDSKRANGGEPEKNNGVLLIIAPNERKVRIEVGYGLEAIMTDALSSVIIQSQILPRFRDNDMPGGIAAGVDAIIAQLTLPEDEARAQAQQAAEPANDGENWGMIIFWVVILLFFVIIPMFSEKKGKRHRGGIGPVIIWGGGSDWGGGSSGGSGWGGGGFSGGGGSFGGGGASGGW
jgi:uncharacterized protein